MAIFINPGTETQKDTTVDNAIKVAELIVQDFEGKVSFIREPTNDDSNGWYGFMFKSGDKEVTVDIPGIDPEQVTEGRPFYSPRLYVDGSSWLYGYALNSIERHLFEREDE